MYVDNVGKRFEVTTEDVVWVIQQAGILGILTALAGIWYQRHKDKMSEIDRVRRTCCTILEEIDDTDKSFNSGKRQQTNRERKNYAIKYTHSYLNNSAFDSLIHSGLFTHFDTKTQIQLSDLYLAIKFHNKVLYYKNEFRDLSLLSTSSAGIKSDYAYRIEYMERYLTQLENETNRLIPKVKKSIEYEQSKMH